MVKKKYFQHHKKNKHYIVEYQKSSSNHTSFVQYWRFYPMYAIIGQSAEQSNTAETACLKKVSKRKKELMELQKKPYMKNAYINIGLKTVIAKTIKRR